MSLHREQTGADLHAPSNEKVENNSAATIAQFRAVTFDGMGTLYMQIELGDGSVNQIYGITQDEIDNTGALNTGFITTLGILTMVDTSSFNVNDLLYAGANGVLQTTENGPAIAKVLVSDATYGKVYVSVNKCFEAQVESMPTCTVSRTTNYNITTGFADVTMNVTNLENEPNTLEHNNTSTARIDIKENGVYLISYAYTVTVENSTTSCDYFSTAQIYKNGSSAVLPLTHTGSNHYSGSTTFSEGVSLSKTASAQFTAGDYITLQLKYSLDNGSSTPTSIYTDNPSLSITKLKGTKGDKGLQWQGDWSSLTTYEVDDVVQNGGSSYICILGHTNQEPPNATYWELIAQKGNTGSGSTITLEDEGVSVTNTPHDTLNFVGSTVAVTDNADGSADITISGSDFGSEYQTAASEGLSTTTSDTYVNKLAMTTTSVPSGNYFITWYAEVSNTDSDRVAQARIELDNTTELGQMRQAAKIVASESWGNFSGYKIVALNGIHTLDIDFRRDSDNTAQIQRARITLWRVS